MVRAATHELLTTGTYGSLEGMLGYGELNDLLDRVPDAGRA